MDIKIGDKVRYLNAVGGGVVTAILPDGGCMVEDESGFDIPFPRSELVVVPDKQAAGKPAAAAATAAAAHGTAAQGNASQGGPEVYTQNRRVVGNETPKCYLAFVGEGDEAGQSRSFDLYMVNDCNHTIFYNILSAGRSGTFTGVAAGILEANSRRSFTRLPKTHLAALRSLIVQVVFYSKGTCPHIRPWECRIEAHAGLFERDGSFRRTAFFDKPALMFKLEDAAARPECATAANADTVAAASQSDAAAPAHQPKPRGAKARSTDTREIDLHTNVLGINTLQMSNKSVVEAQMEVFRREMALAIDEKARRVVFIFGIGAPALKNEIRRALDREYRGYAYRDASFKEYDFGATMVDLRP